MGNSSIYTIKVADDYFKNTEVRKSVQLLNNMDCHDAVAHALTTIRLKVAHEIIDELVQVVEYALNNANTDSDKQLYTKILDKINYREDIKNISIDSASLPSLDS